MTKDSLFVEVVSSYFYGEQSISNGVEEMNVSAGREMIVEVLNNSIGFEQSLMLLIFFGLYALFIAFFINEIRVSLKGLFMLNDTLLIFNNPTTRFNRYIYYSYYFFVLQLCLLAVGTLFLNIQANGLFGWGFWGFVIILLLMLYGAMLLSRGLFELLRIFDYNTNRWEIISRLTRFDRALAVILLPVFFVMSEIWVTFSHLFVIIILTLYFYHIFKILLLFRVNRFSFLQSILYLCAVELAPFALLWGVVWRFKLL